MSVPRTRSTKDKAKEKVESSLKSNWKELTLEGENPGEIYGHSIVFDASSGSLYTFGGCSRAGSYHNNVHRMNLRSTQWEILETTGKRPKGRQFHTAAVIDNVMYIFGGKCNGYMNDMYSLNLRTWEWTEIEPMDASLVPTRRYGHSMVVHRNYLYIFGGYDDFGYKCNDLYEYRPLSNTWTKLKTEGKAPETYHHSAVAHSGSMYVFGGSCNEKLNASTLYEYRFGTCSWSTITATGTPPQGRRGHSSFIKDNSLYVIGGCDNLMCFKDVYGISLDQLVWKRKKKMSNIDPRYFGGCILIDYPYYPPQLSYNSSLSTNVNTTNGPTSSKEVVYAYPTVLHHSQNVNPSSPSNGSSPTMLSSVKATMRLASSGDVSPSASTTSATNSHSQPPAAANSAIAQPPTTSTPSISNSSIANNVTNFSHLASKSSTNLDDLSSSSPSILTSSIVETGLNIIYHGGRNIHNWAFGDCLVLHLDSDTSSDPFHYPQISSMIGNPLFSDISFVFPNEPNSPKIPSHKAILAARCEPFALMLSTGMLESSEGVIQVEDTPSSIYRSFLTFLYSGHLPSLGSVEECLQLLTLADKYFLPFLKLQCENHLKSYISTSNLTEVWSVACQYHASSLQRSCIKFVVRYTDVLLSSAGKKSLPKSLVHEAKAKIAQSSSNTS